MTAEQEQWFLSGHGWTLEVLDLLGIAVPREKLVECLQQLADGAVTTVDGPEETIRKVERWGIVSDENREEMEATIRANLPWQRKVIEQRDKECARLLLDYLQGRWPKLPDLD